MQALAAQYTPQRLRPSLQQHVTYYAAAAAAVVQINYLEISYQLPKLLCDEYNDRMVMNAAVEMVDKEE